MPMTVTTAAGTAKASVPEKVEPEQRRPRPGVPPARTGARRTAATMKPATTCPLPQPLVGAWITANSRAKSATAMVTWPGQ